MVAKQKRPPALDPNALFDDSGDASPSPPRAPAKPAAKAAAKKARRDEDDDDSDEGETAARDERPAPFDAKLVIEKGPHAGSILKLGGGTAVIGRSSKCELPLKASPGVSRRHCQVQLVGDNYVVIDLESRNGTVVNGAVMERKILADGDVIEVGDEHIRYVRAKPEAEGINDRPTALHPPVKLPAQETERVARASKPAKAAPPPQPAAPPPATAARRALPDATQSYFYDPDVVAAADAKLDEALADVEPPLPPPPRTSLPPPARTSPTEPRRSAPPPALRPVPPLPAAKKRGGGAGAVVGLLALLVVVAALGLLAFDTFVGDQMALAFAQKNVPALASSPVLAKLARPMAQPPKPEDAPTPATVTIRTAPPVDAVASQPATDAPLPGAATNAPETNAPATNAPATNAPATNAPVTNASATNAPATNAPATNASASNASASNASATNPSATNASATNASATNASATNASATNAPATNVTAATNAPATNVTATNASSSTNAGEVAEIASTVGGRIGSIKVKVGGTISKGQVLAVMQSGVPQKKLEALREEAREFEDAAGKSAQAKRDLEKVRAELAELERAAKPATVVSDRAGSVVEVLVKPGDVVKPGQAVVRVQ